MGGRKKGVVSPCMRGGAKVVEKTSVWGFEDGDMEGGAGGKGDNGRYILLYYSACSASVCPSSLSPPSSPDRRRPSFASVTIRSLFFSSMRSSPHDKTVALLQAS